jgi:plastocyanin
MQLFTKLLLSAALSLPIFGAQAATFIIQVDPNGGSTYEPDNLTIQTGDRVTFQWVSGTHPTMSDSSPAAWATFTPSATNTRTIAFPTPGTYPFHCTAHGFPGGGMSGVITVTLATPTLDARPTAPVLNLFPNPSRGQVTVQLNHKSTADYQLRLSNIIGREVRSFVIKPDLSPNGLLLNLGDLPAGLYFYSLLQNDKVLTTQRLTLQD